MTNRNEKLLQAMGTLLCAAIAWRFMWDLEGTEFSGGRITGRLLEMESLAGLLFLLALPLTFFFRRVAAAIAFLGCFLCLPLYLYFTAPGPFRSIVRGDWKVPLTTNFVWDWWSLAGFMALILTIFASLRGSSVRDR